MGSPPGGGGRYRRGDHDTGEARGSCVPRPAVGPSFLRPSPDTPWGGRRHPGVGGAGVSVPWLIRVDEALSFAREAGAQGEAGAAASGALRRSPPQLGVSPPSLPVPRGPHTRNGCRVRGAVAQRMWPEQARPPLHRQPRPDHSGPRPPVPQQLAGARHPDDWQDGAWGALGHFPRSRSAALLPAKGSPLRRGDRHGAVQGRQARP